MVNSKAHSCKNVKLWDRTLWFDGKSTVKANKIIDSIVNNIDITSLYVDDITPDIANYNALVPKNEQISVKTDICSFNFDWNIPVEFKSIDVPAYIHGLLLNQCEHLDDFTAREARCAAEMILYDKLGLFDTLRTLIYIINTLEYNNVVWGVGRGSSVSSYVLYLIGVHDIDSYQFGLDISEFLRLKTE